MANKVTAAVVFAAVMAGAQGANAPQKQHVPERLDKVRLIHPAAADKNHILVVNVADAIPADTWGLVSTYATSRLQLNVWTNSASTFDAAAYATDPTRGRMEFGQKAKICLFIVNSPTLAPFTGVPRLWCAANVGGLSSDGPDTQTLRDRYAKTILKGLAYACGSGATLESGCSLFYGSSSLGGMDRTGIMISPMAYFPMLEALREIGGTEMLSPAME